jgi:hypothetical protein
MLLHKILSEFREIIEEIEVLQFEVTGPNSRIKLRVDLRDGSQLFAREIVLDGRQLKYAYHWKDAGGRLLTRWDNADHWPEIATSPHHKHISDEKTVVASDATSLEEVLRIIRVILRP